MAYRPQYALNVSFDSKEFLTYLKYLAGFCLAFTVMNYMENWSLNCAFLGFAIALLNYMMYEKVFGIITPERTLIRARAYLDGSPEHLAKAFTETHCDLKFFAKSALTNDMD